MTPSVYPFLYLLSAGSDRITGRRDMAAMFELMRPLQDRGYRLGDCLLNFPLGSAANPVEIDLSSLGPDDLVAVATRLPRDDDKQGDRLQVPVSGTVLEGRIFDVVGRYFDICSRTNLVLKSWCAEHLPDEWATMAHTKFKGYHPANLTMSRAITATANRSCRWHKTDGEPPSTVVFLVRSDALWEGGPGLVAAFGMGRVSTYAWCYRLGHDLSYLLDGPRFVMAKASLIDTVPLEPMSRWAMDMELETILELGDDDLPAHVNAPGKPLELQAY